jgi:thioredoxin-like negative regulator of GroEL
MPVTAVRSRNFSAEVLKADRPVLVAFRASWCRPSLDLVPVIDELDTKNAGVKVVSVDFDADKALCSRYNVTRVPVTMMFAEGQVVDFIGGFTDKKSINEMVRRRLEPVLDVDERTFDTEVLKSSMPTLVHFGAKWCAASKLIEPVVLRAAESLRGQIKVTHVEFGPENARLCAAHNVVRVPTVQLFVGGKMQDQILGAMVGGTKRGAVQTSCVGLTSDDNILGMVRPFLK